MLLDIFFQNEWNSSWSLKPLEPKACYLPPGTEVMISPALPFKVALEIYIVV